MRSLRRRPSAATLISIVALFVALGGTATAASVLIRSSSQIKNGAVSGLDLKNGSVGRGDLRNNAVDSAKIASGAVSLDDLSSSAKSAIDSAGTQALEAFRLDGPQGVAPGATQKVATLSGIPAGVYAIFGKTVLTAKTLRTGLLAQGQSVSGHCTMDAQGDQDQSRALLGAPGANAPGQLNLQITRTFAGTGEVTLTCDVQDAEWNATNTSIIAVRVGAAPRQAVDG
jgi:hypothetical protein